MDDFDEVVFRNWRLDSTGEEIYRCLKDIYHTAESVKLDAPEEMDIGPLVTIRNRAIHAAVTLLFND